MSEDPTATFERARELLLACDGRLWLPKAATALRSSRQSLTAQLRRWLQRGRRHLV
jgi:hypothetical protein